jgi:uncharacterized membrane protein
MTIRGSWAVALLVALGLSLAANLFIGGFAGGWALFGGDEKPTVDRWIGRIVESVPKEARQPVRDTLESHKGDIEQRFAATRDARRALSELMRRPDLTRDQLDAAYSALGDTFRAAAGYTNDLVATAVLSVPPEVRAKWNTAAEEGR